MQRGVGLWIECQRSTQKASAGDSVSSNLSSARKKLVCKLSRPQTCEHSAPSVRSQDTLPHCRAKRSMNDPVQWKWNHRDSKWRVYRSHLQCTYKNFILNVISLQSQIYHLVYHAPYCSPFLSLFGWKVCYLLWSSFFFFLLIYLFMYW